MNETTNDSSRTPPRAFISYSWTSDDRANWVLELATDLVEVGVDVIIDRWDLKEGADKYAFMEKMVTDSSINKVIVVCDKVYAEKADGRLGGVGTETQIISQKLYSQIDADDQKQKFVAVIAEVNEKGDPYVPTFLKHRIYIDMSDPEKHAEMFEQLVRWIFDQPLHKKPEIGKPPEYLFTEESVSLATAPRYRMVLSSLQQNKDDVVAKLDDYFSTFCENFESLRLTQTDSDEYDEEVIKSIDLFLPQRNETISLLLNIAKYNQPPERYEQMHSFLERLLPYGYWPLEKTTGRKWDEDNLRFIIHELFLYSIAALVKYGRFDGVNELTEQHYYFPAGFLYMDSGMVPFGYFRHHLESLEQRNKRLKLNRASLVADKLKERATISDISFEELMQADFILFLRSEIEGYDHWGPKWRPDTLLYRTHDHRPFEVFARAQSTKYFSRMMVALGIREKSELEDLMQSYSDGTRELPHLGHGIFDPAKLSNIENIASKP